MRFSLRPGFSLPARERIDFDLPQWWQITRIESAERFFINARLLLPPDSFIFFEGGHHSQEYHRWLLSKSIDPQYSLRLSTMLFRPFTVHLPATTEILGELAVFASKAAGPELCGDMHGYSGGKILFAWFDAFLDPLLLPPNTAETAVKIFSSAVGGVYEFIDGTT
jgi:hypothetical protein